MTKIQVKQHFVVISRRWTQKLMFLLYQDIYVYLTLFAPFYSIPLLCIFW